MFERFTRPARVAVVLAQEEAREAGSTALGAEHLLHGVVADTGGVAAAVLSTWGVDAAGVSRVIRSGGGLDAEALSTFGIDLDEVRRRVEDAFGAGALEQSEPRRRRGRRAGQGHIPFTTEAKQALEQALRAAVRGHDTEITTAHVFLGLLAAEPGTAYAVLHRLGVTATPDELRGLVRTRLDDAA